MLDKHVTRDGDEMLIAQMSDQHLVNFIKLILESSRKARELVKTENFNEFERSLYNLPEVTEKDAAELTRAALRKLYPYLAEAYLRNLDEPRNLLVEILGRDCALPKLYTGLLPPSDQHYNPIEWEEGEIKC